MADIRFSAAMDLDILHDYLIESKELLEKAQADTLRLEENPDDGEALASIFRAFHTIKGGAAFLEADNLVDWAHHLEELLDKLRSGNLPVTAERIDVILKAIDVMGSMLAQLAEQQPPDPGPEELAGALGAVSGGEGHCDRDSMEAAAIGAAPGDGQSMQGAAQSAARSAESAAASELSGANTAVAAKPVAGKPRPLPDFAAAAATNPAPPGAAALSPAKGSEAVENSMRVDATRLDAVMNQVGELVLLRNRLSSAVSSLNKEDEDMSRIAREMDLRVSDLQNTVMRLRMQPCKRLLQQLPRVVRDVSRQLHKEVRLEITGEDVEIDKAVVDALSGPMTHLVRNSLDHGLEVPAVRVKANKPAEGLLRIAAVHLGDRVRIEVSDDGRGIDRRVVLEKAVKKGVITPDNAAHLSEQDALELIFRPGFSTREEASDLSGRGVGMDVVKETTDRLRGRLTVESVLGHGTTVAMEFPLTLAVLPFLYLRVRQDTYALPVSTIDSLTDIEEDRVHRLAGRVTYRVSGSQTVPLVDLGAILQDKPLRLGVESAEGVLTERGLFVVSEVLGNEDSVVKPIDFFSGRNLYQGATISGRGNVVLILDAAALSATAATAVEGGR